MESAHQVHTSGIFHEAGETTGGWEEGFTPRIHVYSRTNDLV